MSGRMMFTVAREQEKYGRMGMALGRSLQLIEDQTPRAVLTDLDGFDWARYFQNVIRPPANRTALDKLLALELTGADEVVALDCDCLAFQRLDPIFEFNPKADFAVQGFEQSSGLWHGANVQDISAKYKQNSIPRFNGGMLYYRRKEGAQKLIERARAMEADYRNLGFVDFRGNASEEVCVALAMLETGLGSVWPDETDFMSTGVGMVGKPRVDILDGECSYLAKREGIRFIRPIVFHAARYVNFMFYWKQIRTLEWLEKIEDRTVPGFRSPKMKRRRSFGKRWLSLTGQK
jgi:hypothetical protein